MSASLDPARASHPGAVVWTPLPEAPVLVRDPSGAHEVFRAPVFATRVGENRLGAAVLSVGVRLGNAFLSAPPDWVRPAGNVVAFRPAPRFKAPA